jgi:hypothetical protein
MEALNGGKVFANAYLSDLGGCIKALKYCAGWADKIHGQTIPSGKYTWKTNGDCDRGQATITMIL